jgi:hypothetical protein
MPAAALLTFIKQLRVSQTQGRREPSDIAGELIRHSRDQHVYLPFTRVSLKSRGMSGILTWASNLTLFPTK